jgi:hypothetical protein
VAEGDVLGDVLLGVPLSGVVEVGEVVLGLVVLGVELCGTVLPGAVLCSVELGLVVVVVVLVVDVLDCGIVVADGDALVPTCPDEVALDPVLCPAALCMFAAKRPACAYPREEVGLPVCPQWSAILVASVTVN